MEKRQLVQAIRSGRMRVWLEKIHRQMSTLRARSLSPQCGNLLRDVADEVAETDRDLKELTFA